VVGVPTLALGACGRIGVEQLQGSDEGAAGSQEPTPSLVAAAAGIHGQSGDAGTAGYAGVPSGGNAGAATAAAGAASGAAGDAGRAGIGGSTGGAAPLQPLGPFEAPALIEALSHLANDDDPCFTEDRLELYFNSDRPEGLGGSDIWVSRRTSDSPWGEPELVAEVSSPAAETTPGVSPDGLVLWLATDRRGCVGGLDIWVSTRASSADTWSAPVCVLELNSPQDDLGPGPTSTLLEMVMTSRRSGLSDGDLYLATRASTSGAWEIPVMISGVNVSGLDGDARLVRGGLELYMATNRADDGDLYLATRTSTSEPFSEPEPIAELNSRGADNDPWVSEDGRYIVFTSNRSGDDEVYEASR
jgi:hypothetical protein